MSINFELMQLLHKLLFTCKFNACGVFSCISSQVHSLLLCSSWCSSSSLQHWQLYSKRIPLGCCPRLSKFYFAIPQRKKFTVSDDFFYCAFLFHTLCHPFSRHDVPPISVENLDFKITWDFRSSIWTLCESLPFDTLCFHSYPYNQIPGNDHSLYLTFVVRHLPITSCSHMSCCQWPLSFPIFILFFQLI